MEQIEIKRKIYDVIEKIGEHSVKASRKDELFFIKTFDNKKEFENFINSYNKIRYSGIKIPKVEIYDKNRQIVVMEFIEGETIFDMLQKHDLDEEIYADIFTVNFYAKNNRIALNYAPDNFKIKKGKLIYLPVICRVFDEKSSFEKSAIYFWFYTQEFSNYLLRCGLPLDKERANLQPGVVNKKIALTVVKYYR